MIADLGRALLTILYNILQYIRIMVEVLLHTTPSNWALPGGRTLPEAYRRVVAVELASGIIACRYATPRVTQTESFEVPKEFADRLAVFFATHIAGEDPEAIRPVQPSRYNCHLFAMAMRGADVSNTLSAY